MLGNADLNPTVFFVSPFMVFGIATIAWIFCHERGMYTRRMRVSIAFARAPAGLMSSRSGIARGNNHWNTSVGSRIALLTGFRRAHRARIDEQIRRQRAQ